MPTDELPPPEPLAASVETDAPDDARDEAYQEGYDAASDGRKWIRSCMEVLASEIDTGDFDPMSRDAVRELRTAAARRAARILRADIEPRDDDE